MVPSKTSIEENASILENIANQSAIYLSRIHAEEEVKSLAKFPEENPNIVGRVDYDGKLLYCNHTYKKVFKDTNQIHIKIKDTVKKIAAEKIFKQMNVEIEISDRIFLFNLIPIKEENYINFYGRDITERKQADEMLTIKNRMLTSINKYTQAIVFTPTEELFATIATMLKEISGAAEVFINIYDEEKAELVLRKSTLSEENNTWIRKKFGNKLVDVRTPIPRDKYDEIMNSPFGRVGSIHEATFGAIPKSVGRIIEKMLGAGWFVGLALKHNERLVGTIMIAGKKGSPELEKEELLAYASVTASVLAQKHAEVELFQSENRFRSTFEQAAVGIAHVDIDGHFLQVNQKLCSIVGYTREELMQLNFQDITYSEDLETDLGLKRNVLDGQLKTYTTEKRYIRKDGSLVWINLTVALTRKQSEDPDYFISVIEDISKRKKAEQQILHLSFHDHLTGLYNRRFFEEELSRLDTKRQLPLSFIMGDLNGLKLINDVFGHNEGDNLLVKVAQILKKVCRSDDILARWGGDEFVILLPKTSTVDSEEIVERIKKECKKTARQKIPMSLSLGAATKEMSVQDIQAIIIDAESNMYRNKLAQKESSTSSVIFALEQALYEKSNETKEHTERVRDLALKVGKSINLHSSQLDELSLLASLHDIGKVAISETILTKEGKLTKQEWEVIKRHPEIGFNIASSSPQIAHIAKAILSCH
ncbi:MAG: diguanylate cyclase [Firmicutes bacterium]|nr:diguanylate cyclase [Bacillota bacterium]